MCDCWMAVEQKEQVTARFHIYLWQERFILSINLQRHCSCEESHAQSPNSHNQNFATRARISVWSNGNIARSQQCVHLNVYTRENTSRNKVPRTNCAIGFQNCIDLEVLWKSTQKLVICQYSTSQCALLQLAGRRDMLDHQSTELSPMATQSNHKVAMIETADNPFLHICHCRGISNLVESRVVISHNQAVLLMTPNLILNLMR